MVDQVISSAPPFQGITQRSRISLGREYDVEIAYIAAQASLSDEIDVRMAAGVAVSIDTNMTGTHLAVYASAEPGGVKRPVYDRDAALLIVTAVDGSIVVLPSEVFPLGFIALASCSNAAGELQAEAARRQFLVLLKP